MPNPKKLEEKSTYQKKPGEQKDRLYDKDERVKQYVQKRQKAMQMNRANYEKDWDIYDSQVEAPVPASHDGKAQVNLKLEQATIEMRIGLLPGTLQYNIDPSGSPNVELQEVGKYILDHFVEKERVLNEIRKWDYDKAKYGTGILYTGLWFENKYIPDLESGDNVFDAQVINKKETIWHIGIKNVPIRQFRVDERALTIEDAMDCIYEEQISLEELHLRYKGSNQFKYIDSIEPQSANVGSYTNRTDQKYDQRTVKLWHYYNKLSRSYYIIANEAYPIYTGYMTTKHGELPFAVAQEYPRNDSFYGIGIPEKLATNKPYLNNLLKATLDGTWKNSGTALIVGGGNTVDTDFHIESGDTTIWEFPGDAGQVQPYNTNIPVSNNVSIMQQLETYNIQETGISVDPNFVLQAKTAFQTGVFKEEQNARLKTNNDLRDQALDRALTLMFANISQFAPYLYVDFILDDDGEPKNKEWMKIRINGKKVKKKNGKQKLEQGNDNEYSFLELDDKIVYQGWNAKVRINTPATQTNLKSLEKAERQELIQSLAQVAQFKPEVIQKMSTDQILDKMGRIYGIDPREVDLDTDREERKNKIQNIKKLVGKFGGQGTDLAQLQQGNEDTGENTGDQNNPSVTVPANAAQNRTIE